MYDARNEIGSPKVLACPSDDRTPANTWAQIEPNNNHTSFFINTSAKEAEPLNFLLGDRNIDGAPHQTEITTHTGLGWGRDNIVMHNKAGNIAITDGSVQQVSEAALRRAGQAALEAGSKIKLRLDL